MQAATAMIDTDDYAEPILILRPEVMSKTTTGDTPETTDTFLSAALGDGFRLFLGFDSDPNPIDPKLIDPDGTHRYTATLASTGDDHHLIIAHRDGGTLFDGTLPPSVELPTWIDAALFHGYIGVILATDHDTDTFPEMHETFQTNAAVWLFDVADAGHAVAAAIPFTTT